MTVTKHKAFAYITSGTTSGTTRGMRLLLLAHPNQPEAGLQVPAGTMEPGETPEQAVLREAREETDLEHLILVELIGRQTYDARTWGRDELHDRWFFHLRCEQTTAECWSTTEESPSDGDEPVAFELFWVPLDQTFPALIADHDRYVTNLIRALQNWR